MATLAYILHEPVGHPAFLDSLGTGPRARKQTLDLSGSGSRSRRNKWRLDDGYLEMNLAMGPAAGHFTNKLMQWMREDGALSPEFHDWDWVSLPARIMAEEIEGPQIERLRTEVAAFLAGKTKAEMLAQAVAKKLLLAPVMTVAEVMEQPHFRDRDNFQTVSEGGRQRMIVGSFAKNIPSVRLGGAPGLGAHNAEILGARPPIEEVA